MAKNYFGITDTGKRRTNNEDTFIAEEINKGFITACVIDGLGGYEGGEVAAALAKKAITHSIATGTASISHVLKEAMIAANQSIRDEKENNPDYSQMACVCTLALVDVANNKFHYVHVGDTRLYLLRDQSLIKITRDQSFVGFLEDNGKLSETEAMQHPKRNEINKALGFEFNNEWDDYLESGDSPFLPGDTILICSDGLTDMINSETIAATLNSSSSLEQKGNELIDAANDAGGNDNVTVVLVQNQKEQLKETAVKPAVQKKTTAEIKGENNTSFIEKQSGTVVVQKKPGAVVAVLSFLLLCALAAAGWFYYKSTTQTDTIILPPLTKSPVKRNAAEQSLSDSINKPLSQIVNIDSNTHSINITDTIFINKDSLIIHGSGTIIQSDSSFNGPAFVLSDNCKYIVFENLNFQNFNVAISVQRTGLYLKQVRFINCNIPLMRQFIFPDSAVVTGSIPQNPFKTDSIRK